MNRYKTYILTLSLIASSGGIYAQLPDGVSATQSFIDTIKSNYSAEKAIAFDQSTVNISASIPIRVHIIKDIKGSAGVTLSNISNDVTLANNYFMNAGIRFYIDSVDYVNDYNYSYIANNYLRKELLAKYTSTSKINLFLADSINMGIQRSYGFTYFPDVPDSNYIYLDKSYVDGSSLTTMLGHFMGLLSTHETLGGKELSDESNCSSSGDFICDTYADPDLYNNVADTCKYTGTLRDDMGKYYVPSVANIMSNSLPSCRCVLTQAQYRRIYYYYHKYRQYLNY